MRDDLKAAFAVQAQACADLGSPFMARLMQDLPGLIAPGSALARRFEGWQGDLGPSGASLPLRLAGGLHYLALTGRAPGLTAVWPPAAGAGQAAAVTAEVAAALQAGDDFLTDWVSHAPQTNEVGRSAVLLAASALVAVWAGLPLQVSELGASAGLNMNFARYALEVQGNLTGDPAADLVLRPAWSGQVPQPGPVPVAEARGVDLNPLSPATDGVRLLSYVWPDQAARLARMRAALAIAARHPPAVDRGDAAGWLEARLARPWPGRCHLVCHTIAFQYFPPQTQARIEAAMTAAGTAATPDAPLAWLAMEADAVKGSAGLVLRLWPGNLRITLGRAGFHGQEVAWAGM